MNFNPRETVYSIGGRGIYAYDLEFWAYSHVDRTAIYTHGYSSLYIDIDLDQEPVAVSFVHKDNPDIKPIDGKNKYELIEELYELICSVQIFYCWDRIVKILLTLEQIKKNSP